MRIVLICIAIAGIVTMGYLTKLHFSPDENAFCNLGEGLSCDAVNKSEYAKVMGIPMSVMGLGYFSALLLAVLFMFNKDTLKKIFFISVVFLGPSLYLTGIELFVLDNICIFCELSKAFMVVIIIVAWFAVKPVKIEKQMILTAVVLAVLTGGATAFIQANQGPGEELNPFAQCLNEKGFKMYGSATCVYCARQRAMFGPSFEYIKEIECDPRNSGAEVQLCIAKNIEHTPTWIQEDKGGKELFRFPSGVQQLDKLAEASGCELPE